MLQLPFGCYCSDPSIHPANWNKSKASTSDKWYVQYHFYDQERNHKLVIVKGRLNSLKTVKERRAIAAVMKMEIIKLLRDGYNPISKRIRIEISNGLNLSEYTGWTTAFRVVMQNLKIEPSTLRDMKCYVEKIFRASDKLLISNLAIKEVRRKHIKSILIWLEKKEKISPHAYNKCRTYLMMVFKELMEYDLIEYNLVRDISKRKIIKRLRDTLSNDERRRINEYLFKNYYTFWRFTQIFFHSGARIKEMLSVRAGDVDIENQRFKILVKKGRNSREEWRVIKNIALPYWRDLLIGANPSDLIFSVGLKPGTKKILREQITRRWYVHVKKKLNISADFYSLKHLNLDEISAKLDIRAAATMAGHATPVVTMRYAIHEREREAQRLKEVDNGFV